MTQPHPEWTTRLLGWYDTVKRDFPWRQDTDPYRVWVSEIMLQQTRIEAAMGYYRRFMQALPTVADLAAVEDDVLLKLWEGLGYYSRARNLKKAAVWRANPRVVSRFAVAAGHRRIHRRSHRIHLVWYSGARGGRQCAARTGAVDRGS